MVGLPCCLRCAVTGSSARRLRRSGWVKIYSIKPVGIKCYKSGRGPCNLPSRLQEILSMTATLTPQTLAEWLDDGAELAIVDIRPADQLFY